MKFISDKPQEETKQTGMRFFTGEDPRPSGRAVAEAKENAQALVLKNSMDVPAAMDAEKNLLSEKPVPEVENLVEVDRAAQETGIVQSLATEFGMPEDETRQYVDGSNLQGRAIVGAFLSNGVEGITDVIGEIVEDATKEAAARQAEADGYAKIPLGEVNKYAGMDVGLRLIQKAADETEVWRPELVPELLLSLAPFLQQHISAESGQAVEIDVPLWERVFAGGTYRSMQDAIKALPPEEQIKFAKLLKAAIDSEQIILDSNLTKFAMLSEIADRDRDDGTFDWSYWLEQAIGVLDVAGIGATIRTVRAVGKTAIRTGGRVLRMPLEGVGRGAAGVRAASVSEDSARMARDLMEKGLSDDDVAKLLGFSSDEMVEAGLIKYTPEGQKQPVVGPVLPEKYINRFEGEDLDELQADAIEVFSEGLGPRILTERSAIRDFDPATETFQFDFVFGNAAGVGYKNKEVALQQSKLYLGEDAAVEVKAYDIISTEYKSLEEYDALIAGGADPNQYTFFGWASTRLSVRPEAVKGLGLEDYTGGFLGFMKNSWLSSATSKLAEPIRKMGLLAVDDEARILNDFATTMAPYAKMKRSDRQVVDHLLHMGERDGKEFKLADLAGMHINGKQLTVEQIEGYYAYRAYARKAYREADRGLAQKMRQDGMRWLTTADGWQYAAKPITPSAVPEEAVKVFDPTTRKFVTMSRSETLDLYLNGGSLAKPHLGEFRIGNSTADYIVVVPDRVRVRELPQSGVLKDIPGYIPRQYTGNYFVVRQGKGGATRGFAVSNTSADAQRYADAMFAKLNARLARSGKPPLTENPYKVESAFQTGVNVANKREDVFQMENLMFYQDRALNELKNVGPGEVLNDPYEALARNAQTMASKVGTGRIVEVLETKFMKTYGHLVDGGRMPDSRTKIKRPDGAYSSSRIAAYDKEVAEARAFYDHIRMIRHSMSDSQKMWRDVMWGLGAKFDTSAPGMGRAARTFYELSKSQRLTPWALAKTTAFTTQILMAPIRQAIIQSQQAMFLTGIDPTILPKAFLYDAFYLNASYLERTRILTDAPKWRRAISSAVKGVTSVRMNPDEMAELARRYESSGIPSLRAQIQIEDTWWDAPVLKSLGEIGYATGERHNLGATYAFAYRKFLKDNEGKTYQNMTNDDWNEVAFKAREYALSMTRADSFRYQTGVLSAATQYLSIRHKALQAFLGSKAFTPAQKTRMAASQLVLFGAEGLGMAYLVDRAMESMNVAWESEEEKQIVKGGMIDYGLNSVLSYLAGDSMSEAWQERVGRPNVEFSKSFSAMSDIDKLFLASLEFLGTPELSVSKILMGPSYNVESNFGRMVTNVEVLAQAPDMGTLEKAAAVAAEISKLSSFGSNLVKAVFSRGTLRIANRQGGPIVEAHVAEIYAKMLAGFSTTAESEYYVDKYMRDNRDAGIAELSDALVYLTNTHLKDNLRAQMGIFGLMDEMFPDDPVLVNEIKEAAITKLGASYVTDSENVHRKILNQAHNSNMDVLYRLRNSQRMLENPDSKAILDEYIQWGEDTRSINGD